MIGDDGAWLPSITLGVPALVLGVAICIGIVIAAWFHAGDAEMFWMISVVSILTVLGLGISAGFGYWPYSADYHKLQPASGVVAEIDTRFLAASQYVVVTYDTGVVVRCDDSRCATVRAGDKLSLLCTKEHQFGSPLAADGWGCRWSGVQ